MPELFLEIRLHDLDITYIQDTISEILLVFLFDSEI